MTGIEQLARKLVALAAGAERGADYARFEDELRIKLGKLLQESAVRSRFPGVLSRAKKCAADEACSKLVSEIGSGRFSVSNERLIRDGNIECPEGFGGFALDYLKVYMYDGLNLEALALDAIQGVANQGKWESLFNLMNNGLLQQARWKLSNLSPEEWDEVVGETWKTVVEQIDSGKLHVGETNEHRFLVYNGMEHEKGFAAHCRGILANNIKRKWKSRRSAPAPLDDEVPSGDENASSELDKTDLADCIKSVIDLLEPMEYRISLGAWYTWAKYETYLKERYRSRYDFIGRQLTALGVEIDNQDLLYTWVNRAKNSFKKLYEKHCL